jgi:nitrite reductase/ring-hydroxylating ferredoxin subunit
MTSRAKEIYDSLLNEYPHALQTISALSKNTADNKDFILCNVLAFNFDLLTNACINHPNQKEKSPDALFYFNDTLYFIEFKEGDVKKEDVRLKIHEAILTLFHYASTKGIIVKDEFYDLRIKYAVIMRQKPVNGSPGQSFYDTLERSARYFNLKNLEGLMIEETRIAFQPQTIFNLLNKISNGLISNIQIVDRTQTTTSNFP